MRFTRTVTGLPSGENLSALSIRLPRIWRIWTASTRTGGVSAGTGDVHPVGAPPDLGQRAVDEVVDRPHLRHGRERPGLQPRQREQVVHDALEPAHLDADRVEQLAPVRPR